MSKKTIYIDGYCGYLVVAVTENGKLTEFSFEKREQGSVCGNVYKGKVVSVLPGMQAAFIDCGLLRNCYFSAEDLLAEAEKYDGERSQFPELCEGDEVLVQVTKPPVGKKGARVTTQLSFIGKTVIYMPETPFVGVSRKISDEELRKNLLFSAKKLKGGDEGIIVRTAAPYAKRKDVENEIEYLRGVYKCVKEKFKTAECGTLLYADATLPVKVLRETLSRDIDRVIVGSKHLQGLMTEVTQISPATDTRIVYNESGRDLLDEAGLSAQINEMTSPRVELENGAYLVIEKTEALTVIDVNTGKFTGDYSLEQTVYQTNISAAREIARQVKLRNIGGIVVVDFIDMDKPAHNKALVAELERALSDDKAKCRVSPMSKFGLVEFTRERVGSSPLSAMLKPCRNCRGGKVRAPEFIILTARAKILNELYNGATRVRVDLNSTVYNKLACWEEFLQDIKARYPKAELYAAPHKSYGDEQIVCKTDFSEEGATKLI